MGHLKLKSFCFNFFFLYLDDMIETENESLRERVGDLEKKVLEQGDEIVCLRSTLADVLRRLNQLEGCRTLSLNTSALKNGNTPRPGKFVVRVLSI